MISRHNARMRKTISLLVLVASPAFAEPKKPAPKPVHLTPAERAQKGGG